MPKMLKDLSVDEFKKIIGELIEERIKRLLGDPDEGLELKEDVEDFLAKSFGEEEIVPGLPAEEVAKKLNLQWK